MRKVKNVSIEALWKEAVILGIADKKAKAYWRIRARAIRRCGELLKEWGSANLIREREIES